MKQLTNCLLALLILFACNVCAENLALTETNGASIAPMLQRIMPAVVNITVIGELPPLPPLFLSGRPDDQSLSDLPRKFQDMGSGVIVNAEKGYIVTNAHVVRDEKLIIVTLSDGRRFKAKLIGEDKATDIAVLQIKASKLEAIPFVNSDKVKVGSFVAAIGNPFGLHQTVTSGMVSALNRSDLGIEGYENFIQTDAPINPGNSGGALVNLQGQLVGINTAILAPAGGNIGIGFAIPSNMVKAIMDQLIKNGKVNRGILGVMVQDLTPALAKAFGLPENIKGALVTEVNPGTAAAKAGFKIQDVILSVNGQIIDSAAALRNDIGVLPEGSKLQLVVRRGSHNITLTANTESVETLKTQQQQAGPLLAGVGLRDFNQVVPGFGHVVGVQITAVKDTSNAWIDGARPGDVILSANDKAVSSIATLDAALQANSTHLLLRVRRINGVIYLVISNNLD